MIGPEPVVAAYLQATYPDATVMTETPADLVGALPFIKVVAVGGGRDLGLGASTVDVECYAATRDAARDLAGDVNDALMYGMRAQVYSGSIVSAVRTISLPAYRPYDNDNVRRFGLTLQIYLRDQIPATF